METALPQFLKYFSGRNHGFTVMPTALSDMIEVTNEMILKLFHIVPPDA